MSSSATELLRELVAQRSVSSTSSRGIIDWTIDASGAAPDEVETHTYAEGSKANVLLRRGREDGDRGLLLCGHLDVVPANEDGWESDPWTLTDRGDRWVGRGSCDMKAFVALALDRFRRLEGKDLTAPLAVLLTSDEEVGSLGAQRWVADRGAAGLPRQVLIGEPTGMRAVRLHKGHLRMRLTLRGTAAHSGYPHRGRNAIEAAGRALVALASLRGQLEAERPPSGAHFPEVPYVALNVGGIRGGVAVNVIPDLCVVDLGLRPLPGVDSTDLAERVEGALAPILADEDWQLEVDNDSPPLETADDEPLYAALCEMLGQSEDVGVSFASDGGTFGRAGLACVLFGPGSIEVAHRPNEFLPKAEFEQAGVLLDELIERFCGARP